MWFVYIIECRNRHYYTGITNDIPKRMKAHKEGKASKYTTAFGFKKLLYREEHLTKSQALMREAQIKQMTKRDKTMLIKSNGDKIC